ncbi:hypothetical protein [Mucilaginibacter hurinus]|nr:hypothetical protein [Mucilaginibacter hurinus]
MEWDDYSAVHDRLDDVKDIFFLLLALLFLGFGTYHLIKPSFWLNNSKSPHSRLIGSSMACFMGLFIGYLSLSDFIFHYNIQKNMGRTSGVTTRIIEIKKGLDEIEYTYYVNGYPYTSSITRPEQDYLFWPNCST